MTTECQHKIMSASMLLKLGFTEFSYRITRKHLYKTLKAQLNQRSKIMAAHCHQYIS